MTEPCASSTARDTMFSEAISSISSRWRPSSSSMARAISGSLSARLAEKKLLDRWLRAASLALMGNPHLLRAADPAVPGAVTRSKAAARSGLFRGLYHGPTRRANPQDDMLALRRKSNSPPCGRAAGIPVLRQGSVLEEHL